VLLVSGSRHGFKLNEDGTKCAYLKSIVKAMTPKSEKLQSHGETKQYIKIKFVGTSY